MKKSRFILFFLITAHCLAISSLAAHYEAFEHPDIPYSEMTFRGVDLDAVDRFCDRFADDPAGQYEALIALYDEISTQRELANIRMCQNPADEAACAANEQTDSDFSRASDAIYLALSEALEGAQGDALAALMPEGQADAFRGYVPADETRFEAMDAESALIQAYYALPYDDAFAENAAELYLRLAELRREEAARQGFDSYADYAYLTFSREYDRTDARELARIVREQLAPLYVRCELALDERGIPWDDASVPDSAEILDALRAHMGDVSDELTEALDYLCRNGLYCIGGEPMYDTGFTTCLPAYRSPFLFNYVSTRFGAFQSTVHEFGHFNAAYHDPTPILYQYDDMDLSEIQSQALELLFLPCLEEILVGTDADRREVVTLYALSQMLSTVVDGCLYDEFEQAVYADPDLTAAELNELERSLYRAYGLDALYADEPFWCTIPHLFNQPFYYISYAVSALPALDVWLCSRTDYDAAVEAYLNVSAARTDAWFLDVLYDNGLCDVTDPAAVRRLTDGLQAQLEPLLDRRDDRGALYLAAAGGVALAAVVCIVLVRRRREAEPSDFCQ